MLPEAPLESPVLSASKSAGVEPCPRCKQQLIDPAGLGWCKACGYCRSLEAEQDNQLLQTSAGPSRGAALAGAAGQIPWWIWGLGVGVAVVAGGSLAADRLLLTGNGLPRALWTSVQIGVGLVLIFAGQFFALVQIAHEDATLSFKDALVPTRLWHLAGKRMSRLYGCLWTSAWGLSLVVCAFLFIGGLKHWFTYLPNTKNGPATQNGRK